LNLDELERMALQFNPTLVQARAQVDASLSKSLQAGLPPNPIAGYVSEQMGAGGGPGETQGGFVEQEIIRGGKLRLSRAKYRQEAAQAQIQVWAQQMRIINGVRMRFFDVLAAQRLVEVERELLQNHDELLRTTREMSNLGQANRPDVLQAQIALQRQRVTLRRTENRWRKSWEGLITVVGAPQLPFSPVAGDLDRDIEPLDWNEALRQILEHSPEIQVARAEVVRDEITVQRERVQPIPNAFLRVETGYNWEVNLTTAGVQLGWNLPVWNRNQGTIGEAIAEVARARAEVTRLELFLRRRLAEVFARYQTALATVQTYRAETLPQAREAYQLNLAGYRQRRAPWAQVVLSQRTFSDLAEEYVETLLELRHAEVEIRGMLLVDGLSQPEPPTPGGHIDATPQPR
jgi:cobalt-zinc-cadmium efflux system outer membrane protein